MNCRRAKKLVFELMDGLADESVRLDLENHLAQCRDCETLASRLTRSMDLIHRAPVETLDENFNWKVRLAVHRERNAMQESLASQGALFRAWNLRYAASAAAGFVMIVAIGWMALGTGALGPRSNSPLIDPAPVARTDDGTATPAGTPERPTQMVESPFTSRSQAQPVAGGAQGSNRSESLRSGAITPDGAAVDLDSLIRTETAGMSDAERAQYLQERIELFQRHLDPAGADPR